MKLDEIRALAERYAATYNADHIAPFPYERVVAAHPELKIYYTALDDGTVSGAILFKDSEYSILINTNHPTTRQHFTLGREMGHFFLHKDIIAGEHAIIDGEDEAGDSCILYRIDEQKAQHIETEADNFAGSLIMPEALVRRAWQATNDIQEAAQIFNVSPVAMSKRLTILGLIGK